MRRTDGHSDKRRQRHRQTQKVREHCYVYFIFVPNGIIEVVKRSFICLQIRRQGFTALAAVIEATISHQVHGAWILWTTQKGLTNVSEDRKRQSRHEE